MNERLKFNKMWEIILVSFLAGVIVAGISVGAYFYFGGDAAENNGTYLLNQKKSSKDVDALLTSAEQNLAATAELDTSDVDASLSDLNAIDLSGI